MCNYKNLSFYKAARMNWFVYIYLFYFTAVYVIWTMWTMNRLHSKWCRQFDMVKIFGSYLRWNKSIWLKILLIFALMKVLIVRYVNYTFRHANTFNYLRWACLFIHLSKFFGHSWIWDIEHWKIGELDSIGYSNFLF